MWVYNATPVKRLPVRITYRTQCYNPESWNGNEYPNTHITRLASGAEPFEWLFLQNFLKLNFPRVGFETIVVLLNVVLGE